MKWNNGNEMIYIAFIRNVMLGRQGLTQNLLRSCFTRHGACQVVSHLATGNVSFELDPLEVNDFKHKVEFELAGILNRHEPVFIRSLKELQQISFQEIFCRQYAAADVYEQCITFLADRPELNLPLLKKNKDVEVFAGLNQNLFSITRLVNNRPGGPNKLIEGKTGQLASTRNIRTVTRILERLKKHTFEIG